MLLFEGDPGQAPPTARLSMMKFAWPASKGHTAPLKLLRSDCVYVTWGEDGVST